MIYNMLNFITNFIERNKEFINLVFFFLAILVIINSSFFFPITVSIVISYFLYILKNFFCIFGISKKIAFFLTYLMFATFFLLIIIFLCPIIFRKIVLFFNDLPFIIKKIQILTDKIIIKYPSIFTTEQMNVLFSNVITYVRSIGKTIISASLFSIVFIIRWVVFIFLIPIFIFFFLKDYERIFLGIKVVMPNKFIFLEKIWKFIDKQISNYVLGKCIEFFLIFLVNYFLFSYYKIFYSDLLSFFVGLSVFLPYVGTIIVSIPIVLIAGVQLGASSDCFYFLGFYAFIQFLDGNLLVPILFSEALDLHPVIIILSIIVFGSIFGLYGIVFAIPFAIVVRAIIVIYLMPKNKL